MCVLHPGKRPFGVSLLYIGWDKHYGFQLYQSDPSGNYGGWKATCIGNNSAVSLSDVLQSSCSVPCSKCIISVGCNIASGDTRGCSCTLLWCSQYTDTVAYLVMTVRAANCVNPNSWWLLLISLGPRRAAHKALWGAEPPQRIV